MNRKPLVATFRLGQATKDMIAQTIRHSRYKSASSFIRDAIDSLLKREAERPSGWSVRR
jgi:Arc/MetJ-type ribon-helix-helix transcriptional regulator